MATLTRKHFAAIADNIKHRFELELKYAQCEVERKMVKRMHMLFAKDMAAFLSSTNGSFNRQRFLEACGVDSA